MILDDGGTRSNFTVEAISVNSGSNYARRREGDNGREERKGVRVDDERLSDFLPECGFIRYVRFRRIRNPSNRTDTHTTPHSTRQVVSWRNWAKNALGLSEGAKTHFRLVNFGAASLEHFPLVPE